MVEPFQFPARLVTEIGQRQWFTLSHEGIDGPVLPVFELTCDAQSFLKRVGVKKFSAYKFDTAAELIPVIEQAVVSQMLFWVKVIRAKSYEEETIVSTEQFLVSLLNRADRERSAPLN